MEIPKLKALYELKNMCIGFAFAGVGGSVSKFLLSNPGASAFLSHIYINYSKPSTMNFVKPFQLVSFNTDETSLLLSLRSLLNMYSEHSIASSRKVVAVGATAAFTSNYERRGKNQAFITVRTKDRVVNVHVVLEKGARTRGEEEDLISKVILIALCRECGIDIQYNEAGLLDTDKIDVEMKPEMMIESYFSRIDAIMSHSQVLFDRGLKRRDVLPNVKVILPGSFNPLHEGHTKMIEAAVQHLKLENDNALFEITVSNPDKGVISQNEMLTRMHQFYGLWKVSISTASLYIDKARLNPDMIFVVGMDTYMRIIDEKYYNNSKEEMFAVLNEFLSLRTVFLVAGRIVKDEYRTLHQFSLDAKYERLFQHLPEFREDISSTEVREKQEKGGKSNR